MKTLRRLYHRLMAAHYYGLAERASLDLVEYQRQRIAQIASVRNRAISHEHKAQKLQPRRKGLGLRALIPGA